MLQDLGLNDSKMSTRDIPDILLQASVFLSQGKLVLFLDRGAEGPDGGRRSFRNCPLDMAGIVH